MRKRYYFLYFLILVFIGLGLISCGKKNSGPEEIIIEAFDYEINRNKSTVANELSYSLVFDIDFTLNQEFNVDDLVVRIATVEDIKENNKSFHFDIDYSNTEKVTFSSSNEEYPYILLKYAITDVTAFNVNAQIKITSKDLVDDINKFIKIDCSCESKEIVDKNNILNNGIFQMSYSDDSLIYYEYDEFKESYTVVSVLNRYDSLEIPATYKGHPVKIIGEGAFYGCSNLKSVIIPDSVISIEANAFGGCSSLTSMTIPFIGASTDNPEFNSFGYFFGADTPRDNSIFVPKSLREVTVTRGTNIGEYAFEECNNITKIELPDTVTNIGDNAFYNCSSLTNITIPNSVTSIGDSAFSYCSNLTNITIPNGVTSIGTDAFSNCSNLTSIIIPNSMESIGVDAFLECNSLQLNEYDNGCYLGNSDNPYLCLIKVKDGSISSCEINENTKFIYQSAFLECSNLTDIVLPDCITIIENDMFNGCSSLKSIVIPDGVIGIGESAFFGCSSLTSINIPKSVTFIGSSAFYGCSNLKSVSIPDSVTSIGWEAFSGCKGLTSITIPFVGASLDGTRNTHFGFIFGASSYGVNKGSVPISLKEVIITGGTSIAANTFDNCSNLTKIVLPDSVTEIGEHAFYNCSSLTSMTIPFTGRNIGDTRKNFLGFLFGASSYSVHSGFVPYSLKEVIITKGTIIGENAFDHCNSLTSITLPASITNIGSNAFMNCGNLTNIYYEGTNEDWCSISFGTGFSNPMSSTISHFYLKNNSNEWEELTSIEIPNTIIKIKINQFYGFNNITTITIPEGVTNIDDSAFSDCSSLKEVYYKGTADEWNSISIKMYNSNLTSATIYYYSEKQPTEEGNYWHYVDGKPTKW